MTISFYLTFIFISAAAGFIFLIKKPQPKKATEYLLASILVFVLIFEVIGNYTASRNISNVLLYNICWVYLESTLLILYFALFEENTFTRKKIIAGYTLVLAISITLTMTVIPITTSFHYLPFLLFAAILLVLSINFLVKVMSFKIFADRNLLTIPQFYLAVGIIFFYTEAIITFGLLTYYKDIPPNLVFILTNFNRIVAGLMYLLFGFSFIAPYLFSKKRMKIIYPMPIS